MSATSYGSMQPTKIANDIDFSIDTEKLTSQLRRLIEEHARLFDSRLRRYCLIYLFVAVGFISLLALFIGAVVGTLPPYIGGVALGILALGGCVSFLGHRYLSLYKPTSFSSLVVDFGETCRHLIPYHDEISDHHLFLASAYTLFAEHLKGRSSSYFSSRYLPQSCNIRLAAISEFCYHNDLHTIRELLLTKALEEHLDLVKRSPLNLTYHSQLASTYVLLSRLFLREPRFRHYASRAVAEFQIIAAYAPTDPWVHSQLAMSYRDLEMPHEEASICEAILKLCPTDSETLLRLGTLHFQLGDNARGLAIYEELRHLNWQLAEQLITHYGDQG